MRDMKTAREVIRIKRSAVPRTKAHLSLANSFKRISVASRFGGFLGHAVNFGAAAKKYDKATNQTDRTGIIADYAGGIAGSMAAGAAIALCATPVGWAGIAVVLVGSAVGGMAGGLAAEVAAERMIHDSEKSILEQFLD